MNRFYLKLLHEMSVIYVFSIPKVQICKTGEVVEAIVLIPQLLRWVCGKHVCLKVPQQLDCISPMASQQSHICIEAQLVMCKARPQALKPAKPSLGDSFEMAWARPGGWESLSRALKPGLAVGVCSHWFP